MVLTSFNQSRVHSAITKCEKSVTTTSGTKAVNEKKVCSGDLIFEESFDGTLDMDIWQHDITFTGDSVRILHSEMEEENKTKEVLQIVAKTSQSNFFSFSYFPCRITSSNGTQTTAQIPSLTMEI